jgi:hypothetical protein
MQLAQLLHTLTGRTAEAIKGAKRIQRTIKTYRRALAKKT